MISKRNLAASKTRPLTAAETSGIRRTMAATLIEALPHAREAVLGLQNWSPSRVNLFRILANKVIPDVTQAYTQVDVTHRSVPELTRAELEQIAAGLMTLEASPILGEDQSAAGNPSEIKALPPSSDVTVQEIEPEDAARTQASAHAHASATRARRGRPPGRPRTGGR